MKAFDWSRIASDLDAQGCAVVPKLLKPAECRAMAARYDDEAQFRSRVIMARHGYGRGEYRYFGYPLPESYMRYLQNAMRKVFHLEGTPIRFHLRQTKNPFADK